jgi:hypothetical protein
MPDSISDEIYPQIITQKPVLAKSEISGKISNYGRKARKK